MKLKRSGQLIGQFGQFGHVTASAVCKQPEKHGKLAMVLVCHNTMVTTV
jgi:hypothetical protein